MRSKFLIACLFLLLLAVVFSQHGQGAKPDLTGRYTAYLTSHLPSIPYAAMFFQSTSGASPIRVVTALPVSCTAIGAAGSSRPIIYQGKVYQCTATDTWTAVSTGSGISGLTSGRIPYATNSTTLTDTANLTWDNVNSILTVTGGTAPLLKVVNSGASGKTAQIFAGTSGIGFGTPTRTSQFIIIDSAPNSGLVLGAGGGVRMEHAFNEGIIAAGGMDNYIKTDSNGTAAKSLFLQGFNGAAGWESALKIANKASGTIDLNLTPNGGLVYSGTSNYIVPNVRTGTAAPAVTPQFVGQFFLDTSNQKLYVAKGTSSSADFVILN